MATNPQPPTIDDCLAEIRRLRAANERLERLVQSQRPELGALRDVEVSLRHWLLVTEQADDLKALRTTVLALLPGHDDLPSTAEVTGVFGEGKNRVDAALKSEVQDGD